MPWDLSVKWPIVCKLGHQTSHVKSCLPNLSFVITFPFVRLQVASPLMTKTSRTPNCHKNASKCQVLRQYWGMEQLSSGYGSVEDVNTLLSDWVKWASVALKPVNARIDVTRSQYSDTDQQRPQSWQLAFHTNYNTPDQHLLSSMMSTKQHTQHSC